MAHKDALCLDRPPMQELCRDAEDVQVVRGPDELQEWEIPAHSAMQLNSLRE